jgi:hypothetical protein
MESGIERLVVCVSASRLKDETRSLRGSKRRTVRSVSLVALAGAVLLAPRPGHAFKLQTHEAVAIEAANQLATSFPNGGAGHLKFVVNGKELDVPLNTLDVVQAIQHQQSYFLAGAVGPDGFPDPITGQWLAHENGTPGKSMEFVAAAAGRSIIQPNITDTFESRNNGVFTYRAIDFAMDLVQFWNNDYSQRPGIAGNQTIKDQVLAFIAGYFAHGVTDSFAHTWVNDIVGHSWDLFSGSGMFGTLTEEVRHVSIEAVVDHRAPKTPFATPGDGGGFGKLELNAPVAFLDAFYSTPTSLGKSITADPSNDPISFLQYFRNLDLYRGGPVMAYLNAQVAFPGAVRSWSRLGFLFDIAEAVNNNTLVQLFFSLIDIPLDIINELLKYAPQGINDVTKLATFGYASCLPINTINALGTPVLTDGLQEALQYLGGMNQRIAAQTERARVGRYNIQRLSECIGESLTKLEAPPWDPTNPTVNTDPCADIIRAGWQDENPSGLYRGNIKGFFNPITGQQEMNKIDAEFLMDLKGSFLGSNPDDLFAADTATAWKTGAPYNTALAYEGDQSKHRSALANYERVLTYLKFPGLTVGGLGETFLPSDPGSNGSPSPVTMVNAVCADARDTSFEHCLNLATLPIAAAARQFTCFANWESCAVNAGLSCAQSACANSCGFPIPSDVCSSVCGKSSGNSCINDVCHPVFLFDCIHIPYIGDICAYGADLVVPGIGEICEGVCDIIDTAATCLDDAGKEAVCGVKLTVCSLDNIEQTLELQGLGTAILAPVRKVCDVIDFAEHFVQCVKGDSTDPVVAAADRRTCIVNECNAIIAEAGSNLPSSLQGFDCGKTYDQIIDIWDDVNEQIDAWRALMQAAMHNPEQFVNVTFFQDDVKTDPVYKSTILSTVASKKAALLANPPPAGASADDIQLYNDEIQVLDTITSVANGGPLPPPLTALRLGLAMDALAKQPWPNTLGPTVKKIISDMGSDFNNSFNQVFNSIQATKLIPMVGQVDIEGLFNINGHQALDAQNLLPWRKGGNYSTVCASPMTTLYCDVLKSFDDPNCKGPECCHGAGCRDDDIAGVAPGIDYRNPTGPNNWVPGRSIVAFNPYDPTQKTQNVLTNFPLASTQTAYDKIYTSIFAVPSVLPRFFGFDDPNNPWTNGGGATLTPNNTRSTSGTGSTDLTGCNYVNVNSPTFRTADIGQVGTILQIDVFLPAAVSQGDMQISVTIPGANIFNQYLNNGNPVPLRNLPAGWNTLSFPIPANVVTALLGDFAGAQFFLHVNMPNCTAPVGLDNLRFSGTLTPRTIFHILPSSTETIDNGTVFGFDNLADWTPSIGPKTAAAQFHQGTGALSVPAGGYNSIVSRWMTKAEWGKVTSKMNLDVFLPGPQTNPSWYGDVQLYWECQHLSKTFIADLPLTNDFLNEYNTLTYTLPSNVVSFLQSAAATEQCRVTVAPNTNPGGNVFLDNMGFIQ